MIFSDWSFLVTSFVAIHANHFMHVMSQSHNKMSNNEPGWEIANTVKRHPSATNNNSNRTSYSKSKEASTKRAVPCKFYKMGHCSAGANCTFSHELSSTQTQDLVCMYFWKGTCRYGSVCALPHINAQKHKKAAAKNNKKDNDKEGRSEANIEATSSNRPPESSVTALPVSILSDPHPPPSPPLSTNSAIQQNPLQQPQLSSNLANNHLLKQITQPIINSSKLLPINQPSSLSMQLQHHAKRQASAAAAMSTSISQISTGLSSPSAPRSPKILSSAVLHDGSQLPQGTSSNIPITQRPPTFAEGGFTSTPRSLRSNHSSSFLGDNHMIFNSSSNIRHHQQIPHNRDDDAEAGAILPSSLNELLTPSEQIALSRSAGRTNLEGYFGSSAAHDGSGLEVGLGRGSAAHIPIDMVKRRDEMILTAPASPRFQMTPSAQWLDVNRSSLLKPRSLPIFLSKHQMRYVATDSVQGDDSKSDVNDDFIFIHDEDDNDHHVPFAMEDEDLTNGSSSNLAVPVGSTRIGPLAGLTGSPGGARLTSSSSYGNGSTGINNYPHHLMERGSVYSNMAPQLVPVLQSSVGKTSGLSSYMIPSQRGPRLSYSSIARTGVDDSQADRYTVRHDRIPNTYSNQNKNGCNTESELLCPFAQQGTCRFGEKCKYLHGLPCPFCQKLVLHPSAPQEHAAHIQECTRKQAIVSARNQQALYEDELECVICFEVVKRKKDPRFGLLVCEHPVCLDCIRQWRLNENQSTSKTCPICRTVTWFVIPSSTWIKDSEERERVRQVYKEKLAALDCKHFDFGNAVCPFGSSCFYRHAYPDGTLEKFSKRWVESENQAKIVRPVQLADFFNDYMNTH